MLYNHKFSVLWCSATERDDITVQAVKDIIPYFVSDIFLADEENIGQHTTTRIELVDSIAFNEEEGIMPAGSTAIPVQMNVKKTRELTIKVAINSPLKELLHTVAHELVHVYQSYTADLVCGYIDPETQIYIWEGKAFSTKVIQYKDYPWEVEAEDIASEFMKKCDNYLSFCPIN